jgi:hypothetical protein
VSGRRCSPTEAIVLLAPDFKPLEAAARLEQAIRTNPDFPLWAGGAPMKPNMREICIVVLHEDGRCDIESAGSGLGWARGLPDWEFDVDAVLALKPQPDTRAESAQATAISALQRAEAATAETASVRAELEKALAEARAEAQATRERADAAEKRAEALEAHVEAMKLSSPTLHCIVNQCGSLRITGRCWWQRRCSVSPAAMTKYWKTSTG